MLRARCPFALLLPLFNTFDLADNKCPQAEVEDGDNKKGGVTDMVGQVVHQKAALKVELAHQLCRSHGTYAKSQVARALAVWQLQGLKSIILNAPLLNR
ncbi:MAG: hypothetical protein ACJ8BW_22630 [Ktedonobacteraceae bacterium]